MNKVIEEKEIIGYELIKPEYQKVATKALNLSNKEPYSPFIIKGMISYYLPKIKELGIEEWFEPVYEPDIKLPIINGYEGMDNGDFLTYGCAHLDKNWFKGTSNRSIDSLTLSSGVKITKEQITQIIKYIEHVR